MSFFAYILSPKLYKVYGEGSTQVNICFCSEWPLTLTRNWHMQTRSQIKAKEKKLKCLPI